MLVLIYSPPAPDSCSSPLGLVFPALWTTQTCWCLFRLQSSPLHKSYWCFVWLSDQGLDGGCLMIDLDWRPPCEAASEIVRGPLISSSSSSSPVNVFVLLQIRYCTHAWFWFQAEKLYFDKLHCKSNHMYMWLSLSMIDVDLRPGSLIVWPEA